MKLINLKIGAQLEIGFSIILVFLLVLGVVSWTRVEELSLQTRKIYEEPLAVSNALNNLKSNSLHMQKEMNDLCSTESEKERAYLLKQLKEKKSFSFRQFDVLYEKYQGETSDIDNVYDDFFQFNSVIDDVYRLVREGKKSEAISRTKLNGIEDHYIDQILEKIQIMEDRTDKEGKRFYDKAISLNKAMNFNLIIWFMALVLFSVMLVTILLRNFHRPMRALISATKHFKEGKKEARCSYVSENEFGQLSAAFNELAEKIEAEHKLSEKTEKIARMMLEEEDAHRFGRALLQVLLEETWAQMGALYLLSEDKARYEYFECIGMNVSGCKSFAADKYEGEFGKVLITRKIQHITNIPEDSQFKFSTVVGEFMPREIITIPISTGEEVVAILSLANIKSFSPGSLRLLNSIIDTLNARMGGILAYRKIIAFSQKLEYQNLELESQKKELSAQTSELQEQNMELEIQKKQLDESNKLKTSFLSNMSHELRTPLNSVIALSGVLSRRLAGKVPDEEYSYLDVIERNGRNLLLLINDILDLSRIESGREEIEVSTFDINDAIREIVDMIEPQAVQKNVSLRFMVNDHLPKVNSDYEKILHIIQNLVGNAVKFTEEGYVEVSAQAKDGCVFIAVKDTGIGIEEEYLTKIFEEFRQVDNSNSRKYGGTGLGLSISRKYAELLGGEIEVTSTPGEGSRFILQLPIDMDGPLQVTKKTVRNEILPEVRRPQMHIEPIDANEKTILLVEDTEAVVIQMKDILETQGYQMMVARDGNEALRLISQKIPDGLILDLMMPGVDGFEVLKCIRQDKAYDHVPVIILTAKYVTREEFSFLKHSNIYQLIHKGDINKEKLLEAVSNMVSSGIEPVEQKRRTPVPSDGTPLVLVVEDNPDNLLTIKALLDGKCEIATAEDGKNGVTMAKECLPNLILMDIALPGMSGIDALYELRKDEQLKDVPVIAVSANAMKGDKEDYLAHGFDDYISKPIEKQCFMQIVNEWI